MGAGVVWAQWGLFLWLLPKLGYAAALFMIKIVLKVTCRHHTLRKDPPTCTVRGYRPVAEGVLRVSRLGPRTGMRAHVNADDEADDHE